METIDERIKRANSKYKVEETIDERIERVNREYEWDSRDREMHDWLESSSRTARNANSRLQNSSYTNWKRDSESTRAAVNSDLERADRIKSYLESQREQLGEERYNTFMSRYAEYKNALQQTSQNLANESAYYSDTRNPGVMDSMTEDDMKGRLEDIKAEKKDNRGVSLANRIRAMLSAVQGNKDGFEKFSEDARDAKTKSDNLKSESAALEAEIYNRDIEEKLSQFDEDTIKQIQSVPELKDRVAVEKSVGTKGNDNKVYELNQQIKEIEDKVREKGINPDELEKYFQYEYNSRKNAQTQELIHDFAGDNETLASALSVPINLTSSGKGYLDAAGQHIQNKLTGSYAPIDYNTNAGIASQLSDTMRNAVMENHDWNVGDWDAFDFLYGTGMSALDSAAAAATGNLVGGSFANVGAGMKVAGKTAEAAGGSILGLSAANSAMRDIKARGGSDNQAIVGGAVSGIFEGLFEKVSIGNFNKLKEVDPRSMKDVAMNILKSTGVNFSEEAATEIANIAYDSIANGNISNYKLAIAAYEKQGLSETAAKKKVAADLALQIVEAGAGGALMGAGFGVVGSGLGYLNNRNQGLTVSENQKARQTTPGFEGGEQTQIAQRLESLGESSQDAVKLAPVVLKQTEGDKLTRAEKKLFKSSQNAQNVAAEVSESAKHSIKYDTQNKPFVEIDRNILDGVDKKDWVRTVRNNLREKFPDGVTVGSNEIKINQQSRRELTYSEYMKKLKRSESQEYEDKLRATDNADEIIKASRDYVNEGLAHERSDNISDFARGNVNLRIDGRDYTAEVVVGTKKNGDMLLYDVLNLSPTSINEKKSIAGYQTGNQKESRPTDSAIDNKNIPQKKSYVNPVSATVDGQSVTVNGIDRIEKDGNKTQMYVKTQDGGNVALNEVQFDSREAEGLYTVAQGFDNTNTARAFISGYNQGDSASEYMNAFFDFRRAGMLGQDFDSVLQSTANRYDNLEVSQLRQAYYAGVNEETNAPKLYSKKEEARAEKRGGLLRNYTRKLSAEQAGSVYVMEALAKKYGFVVEMRDTIADGAANGEYDPKTGRIVIALDAEENSYLRVAGHELYHYIENWNPKAAGELREYVIGRLKESDSYDYEGRVRELQKLYNGFDNADIDSEIVAECMFDVFDEKTIRELVNDNRTLAVKIGSWIRGFIESINEALTKLGLKSPEVRALEDDMEALENISSMFKSALEGVKEKKNEKSEGSRYSLKSEAEEKTWYDYSVSFEQQIEDFEKGKLPKYDTLIVGPTPEKMQNVGFNPLPMTYATGHLKTVLQGSKADHDFGKAVLKQIPEAIKNPVAVIASKSHGDTSAVAILDMQYDEKPIVCAVVIDGYGRQNNKMIDSNAITSIHTRENAVEGLLNDAIENERAGNIAVYYIDAKKATGLLQKAGLQLPSFLFRTDGYIHSIRDSESSVKPKLENITKSQQFKRWFGDWEKNPNTASKIVNADGTPKIIYHQTAAEFNVFSNANPLAGRNDSETPNGFFAKDNDADIGVGGNKQMALYGDMKKPLHFKDRAEASEWYSKHIDGYKVLSENLNKIDEEYQSKYDAQETANDEYYEQNYEAYAADDAEVTQTILENEDKLDDILEQWKEAADTVRGEQRELLNSYFIDNDSGYDGIILDFDGRRKGEKVKSYIFFKNTQLKSATDNIGLFDKKNPDIRYSLKNTSSIEEQNKQLIQDNKSLREYTKELERELGLNKKELDERAIRRLSSQILREYSSKYDKETLTQNLKNIFEYIANAEKLSFDDIIARTAEVAKAVIEESDVLNTELSEQYEDFRHDMKTTAIALSDEQKKEVAHYYGSYENFRRSNFGKIKFTTNGIKLEDLWADLSERYPELINPDTHELEQAMTLSDALESIKPYHENPFGMNIDAESYDLAMRLYEEYYNIPELKSLRQRMEQEYRERFEQREAQIRAEEKSKRSKISEQLAKQKAMYEQRTYADRRERLAKEAITKHKRSIERNAKMLNRWLQTPTKTQHVPEALRSMLGEFLVSLDVYGESQSKDAYAWRQSMMELQNELKKLQDGNDEQAQQFLTDLDPDLLPMMSTIMEKFKGSSLSEMDAQGLAELDTIVQQIRGGITKANELLSNSRYESVQALANASMRDMDRLKSYKDKVKIGYKQLNVNMLDSYSYFHQLGPAAESVLKSIENGFNERVEMIDKSHKFMQNTVSQEEIQKWESEKKTFKAEGGEITLTVSQIMEIYNLSKRKQAQDHLLLGGIRPIDTATQETKERVKEKLGKGEETYAKAVQVTAENIGEMIDSLTPKQKQVAEKMQKFLSGNVADWGNKTSMTLYGYRKFTEEHYWPIQVNKNSVRTMNAEEGTTQAQTNFYKLVNIGATKSVQKNASNGLYVKGVFDTFSKHISEMSAYSAYAVPITDAMKWYNAISFEEKEDGFIAISSTKQSIERAFGKDGKAYFEKLILDLNGSSDSKLAEEVGEEKLIRNFKVAAVGANIRVAMQQPTAFIRAAAVMNPKYLLKGLLTKPASQEAIDNCPIAKWKSWGFYETNMGITMKQLITGQQTIVDKVREKSMWLAGKGDEITWGALWNACKAETKDKTDLEEETPEFTQAVSDRLSEIVNKTQVVDSLLHRSQFMRSTSSFSKMLSAFKAEPTKSYNMLRNAIVDYNKAGTQQEKATAQKNMARVAIVHIATSILTAGVAAVADAFRNDDDEKKWLELYLEAFGGNIAEGVNPFAAVPYVGDIISMLSGYDVSRMDLDGIDDLIQSGEAWMKIFTGEKKNADVWRLIKSSASGVSKVSGLPISNILRTFESLYNFFSPDNLGKESNATEYKKLYDSISKGKYQKTYEKLIRKGYTAQQLEDGIKNNLVKSEPRIAQAAQARERGNTAEYKKIYNELVSEGYPSNAVIKAINNYMTLQTSAAQAKKSNDEDTLGSKLESLLESGYSEEEVDRMIDEIVSELDSDLAEDNDSDEKQLYEYKDLQKALKNSDIDSAKEIVEYFRENGKEDKNIRAAVTKEMKTEYQEMYRQNDAEGMRRMRQTLYELNIGYDDEDFQRWIKEMAK